jgi:hypothetical protein
MKLTMKLQAGFSVATPTCDAIIDFADRAGPTLEHESLAHFVAKAYETVE